MKPPKLLRITLYGIATVFLLLLAIIIFVITFNWDLARPYINRKVSAATERTFAIDGHLTVSWQRLQDGTVTGWKRWLPMPYIVADDIRLSNPDWRQSTAQQMVSIHHLEVMLNPLGLFHTTIDLPRISLTDPNVDIARAKDNRNNWTFPSSGGPSVWKVIPHRLDIINGRLTVKDEPQRLNIAATIFSLPQTSPEGYALQWHATGDYNSSPLLSEGKAGGVLSVDDLQKSYPLKASLEVGKTRIAAEGHIQSPVDLKQLDLQLSLSGPSMSNLYPLTGVLLPVTSPFATEGHLSGTLSGAQSRWDYQHFTGHVGGSDINGSLTYLMQAPRPMLRGNLTSNKLVFADLAPLIGGDDNQEKKNRGETARQPTSKVLPSEKFDTAHWNALDADVTFNAKQIIKTSDLPITDLQTHLIMDNKHLQLKPLNFGVAGGKLRSNISLNGRNEPIATDLDIAVDGLQIRKLFPKAESMQASFGEINGKTRLAGQGDSIAAMLASSNGESKTAITSGTVSKFILEAAGLNVANVVISKLFGDKQVQLNCMASDFSIQNGLVKTKRFALDTEDAVINITGDVNLATEAMDLNIKPQSKGIRIISLRSPLYVQGTFAKPDVGVNKTVIAAKASAAAVLATVAAPVAAILPLINPGQVTPVDCAAALADVAKPLLAPAILHNEINTQQPHKTSQNSVKEATDSPSVRSRERSTR